MSKIAIASSINTLEDLLKTNICSDSVIHCQFGFDEKTLGSYYLTRTMKKKRILRVEFDDGTQFTNSTS